MIPVNYYFGVRETCLSGITELRVHIHHYIFSIDNFCDKTVCNSIITWEKTILLVEALITAPADVSAFSQQQVCMNSSYIQILDLLKPVVMYFICFITAAGAEMLTARLLYLYIAAILIFIHISYDYIFQSQQFCCIIFHRAYKFLSLMLSHLHCKGFLCYALLLFLLFSHKIKSWVLMDVRPPTPTFSLVPYFTASWLSTCRPCHRRQRASGGSSPEYLRQDFRW